MPKQKGPVYYTGTRGDACFYEMNGEYYVRKKSTLSGKRVKRDPSFALTRMYAGLLSQSSQIAAAVYRKMPLQERKHAQYRAMTGKAHQMLKQGMAAADISARLKEMYLQECGKKPMAVVREDAPIGVNSGMRCGHVCAVPAVEDGIVPGKATEIQTKVVKLRNIRKPAGWKQKKRIFVRLPKQANIYVNSKGQTVISLTKKHMKKETEQLLL